MLTSLKETLITKTEFTKKCKIATNIEKGWTNFYFDDIFKFDDDTYASFYSNFTTNISNYNWYESKEHCRSLFKNQIICS